jgi:nucleoside-diphosphate-sugar epimerase
MAASLRLDRFQCQKEVEEALAVKVVLTGATGFIGSRVLTELQDHRHEVTALVRDDTQADIVKAMRGAVIAASTAYGDGGGGTPRVLLGSPRDDAGNLIMLGTGQQQWSTVHVADLADFFRRVLEDGTARGRYVIGHGVNPAVADLTEAAAVAVGAPGAVPGSDDEARAHLGDYFADVLLLDQGTIAAKAWAELGWSPSHPSLVDEFRHGSCRK